MAFDIVRLGRYDNDKHLVKNMMAEFWDVASEDGVSVDKWNPEMDLGKEIWLAVVCDSDVCGIANFKGVNKVCVEFHPYIYSKYSSISAKSIVFALIGWIVQNTSYDKVICSIPEVNDRVVDFTRAIGFKEEGRNRLSFRKKGLLVDQILFGLTRSEIKGLTNV